MEVCSQDDQIHNTLPVTANSSYLHGRLIGLLFRLYASPNAVLVIFYELLIFSMRLEYNINNDAFAVIGYRLGRLSWSQVVFYFA